MPALRDVAEEAGVSASTVSRVLNGKQTVSERLRKRVLEAAAAVDYRPNVRKVSSERIGVFYLREGRNVLSSPYEAGCLDGMFQASRGSDFDLALIDVHHGRAEHETYSQFLTRKGLAGAIVRSTSDHRQQIVQMAAEGFPLVVLGDHFDEPDIRFCYTDSAPSSRQAVEHLLSLGHTSIAFACGDQENADRVDRYQAYRAAMESVGLYREELVHKVPPYRFDGVQLARRILSAYERPTALFIADPLLAIGVLSEASRLGVSVPDQLSIIGVDDSDIRNIAIPQMTAVCQDAAAIGRSAFAMVSQLIETGATEAMVNRLDSWFEIHDTTAPAPETLERFLPSMQRRGK